MPLFTSLHRLLDWAPGPISDEFINAAVEARLAETDDLDWKSELPPTRALNETDFPKDIAAMANSCGGVLVYGIEEMEKRATGRKDTGELTERHQSTLRGASSLSSMIHSNSAKSNSVSWLPCRILQRTRSSS